MNWTEIHQVARTQLQTNANVVVSSGCVKR